MQLPSLSTLRVDLRARRWLKAEQDAWAWLGPRPWEADVDAFIAAAGGVLGAFKGVRHFEGMAGIARHLLRHSDALGLSAERLDEPRTGLLRLVGQALIDSGAPTEALDLLLPLVLPGAPAAPADPLPDLEALSPRTPDGHERTEVLGLIGRAYKALYVAASPSRWEPRLWDLHRSLGWYRLGYQSLQGEKGWHGINVAALHFAAMRAAAPGSGERVAQAVACHGLLAELEEEVEGLLRQPKVPGVDRTWTAATALELHLGRWLLELEDADRFGVSDAAEATLDRLDLYLELEPQDFHLGALLRNIEELWQPDPNSAPFTSVVAELKAAAAAAGLATSVDPGLVRLGELEEWRTLLGAVARVEQGHRRLGSAVLVGPRLLLSCDHVVRSPGTGATLTKLAVAFPGPGGTDRHLEVARVIRGRALRPHVRGARQDIAALVLAEDAPGHPLSLDHLDEAPVAPSDRVHFAGYPDGGELRLALQGGPRVHHPYRLLYFSIQTSRGCSGGAVVDEQRRLIGLHSQGEADVDLGAGIDRTVRACQGVPLDRALVQSLSTLLDA